MSTTDAITLDELTAALKSTSFKVDPYTLTYTQDHLNYGYSYGYSGKAADATKAARALVDHAVKNREPEYKAGAVYMDACGSVYQRGYLGRGWFAPGSSTEYAENVPVRPLTKLAPEAKA